MELSRKNSDEADLGNDCVLCYSWCQGTFSKDHRVWKVFHTSLGYQKCTLSRSFHCEGSKWVTKWIKHWEFCRDLTLHHSNPHSPFSSKCSCKLLVFGGKYAWGEARTLHWGKLWQNSNNSTRVSPRTGILAWAVACWPGWLCQDNLGQNSVRYISFVFLCA